MRAGVLVLILSLPGCFEVPKPNCVFLCGTDGQCPDDYMCGTDGRCHLVLSDGSLAMCQDQLPITDAAPDSEPIDADPADGNPG